MRRVKRILASVASAAVLATTMSMGVMADAAYVDLMLTDVASILGGEGGSVKADGASFVFTAGATDTSFTYEVNTPVDMDVTSYLYFDLEATGGWDIKWQSNGKNNDLNPGVSADFGNLFRQRRQSGTESVRHVDQCGPYAPELLEIMASGAYT